MSAWFQNDMSHAVAVDHIKSFYLKPNMDITGSCTEKGAKILRDFRLLWAVCFDPSSCL